VQPRFDCLMAMPLRPGHSCIDGCSSLARLADEAGHGDAVGSIAVLRVFLYVCMCVGCMQSGGISHVQKE